MAAATDLSFNLLGYAAALGNDFLTAWYLIMVKSIPLAQSLTTTGLLFYNAALSLPLLFAAAAMSSELPGIRAYPRKLDSGFQVRLHIVETGCATIGRTLTMASTQEMLPWLIKFGHSICEYLTKPHVCIRR